MFKKNIAIPKKNSNIGFYVASTVQVIGGAGLMFVNPAFGFPLISSGIGGFIQSSTDETLTISRYTQEIAKSLVTSAVCGGASAGTTVLRKLATKTITNTIGKHLVHGALNGLSGSASGLLSGALNYYMGSGNTNTDNTSQPSALLEKLSCTFMGGLVGGYAGEYMGYVLEHPHAKSLFLPSDTQTSLHLEWYSRLYGGAAGFVSGGITGGGIKYFFFNQTSSDAKKPQKITAHGSELGFAMLYSAMAGASMGALESHDTAMAYLEAYNATELGHYMAGEPTHFTPAQLRILELALREERTHLSGADYRTLMALLIKSKHEGLSQEELKYVVGKILSASPDDSDREQIKAYLEKQFDNHHLMKHVLHDAVLVSEGHIHIQPGVLDLKISEDELLKTYYAYLEKGAMSHIGARVEMSLEDIKAIFIAHLQQNKILAPSHTEIGANVNGVYVRSVDFNPEHFEFQITEGPDGTISINWDITYKVGLNLKKSVVHFHETIEGRAHGVLVLGMDIGDNLTPNVRIVSDVITLEKTEAHILHYGRIGVTDIMRKALASHQSALEQQFTQAGNNMLQEQVHQQITAITEAASQTIHPTDGATVLTNISGIEYSHLSWKEGHLGLDIRANCKPAVLDTETAHQIAQNTRPHTMTFTHNDAIDGSTELHAKAFIDEKTIEDTLKKFEHKTLLKGFWGSLQY